MMNATRACVRMRMVCGSRLTIRACLCARVRDRTRSCVCVCTRIRGWGGGACGGVSTARQRDMTGTRMATCLWLAAGTLQLLPATARRTPWYSKTTSSAGLRRGSREFTTCDRGSLPAGRCVGLARARGASERRQLRQGRVGGLLCI